jgi:hypothetical protein
MNCGFWTGPLPSLSPRTDAGRSKSAHPIGTKPRHPLKSLIVQQENTHDPYSYAIPETGHLPPSSPPHLLLVFSWLHLPPGKSYLASEGEGGDGGLRKHQLNPTFTHRTFFRFMFTLRLYQSLSTTTTSIIGKNVTHHANRVTRLQVPRR